MIVKCFPDFLDLCIQVNFFFFILSRILLTLKINPAIGFVANYLCLVTLGYLGGFLLSQALIGWPLGNLF